MNRDDKCKSNRQHLNILADNLVCMQEFNLNNRKQNSEIRQDSCSSRRCLVWVIYVKYKYLNAKTSFHYLKYQSELISESYIIKSSQPQLPSLAFKALSKFILHYEIKILIHHAKKAIVNTAIKAINYINYTARFYILFYWNIS